MEYDYDNGGQLVSMQGNKATTQSYVNNIKYDEFGSRTYFENGNGVSSSYIYNNATRRLQNLSTTATNGSLHDITYTYDPVGNITNITNTATGADGLGGGFTYNYSYDELYRLAASSGGGNTDGDASYTLAMAYSPSGNILQKTLSATKQLLGNSTYDSYSNEYTYSGAHRLANVNDLQGGMPSLGFAFDGNGNMVTQQLYDPNSGLSERSLCWDEENRLSATRDNNYVTANIYDASGNRAWKIAGEMNWMWQNGSGWQGYGDLNLRTWYQSELMTITDVGFTKHYFIAGQKIASKLGEGFRNSDELHPLKGAPLAPIYSDYTELARAQVNRLQRDFDCLGVSYGNFNPGEGNIRLLDDYEVIEIGEESDIYFYHSDHLGSSSFLTDGGGVATQHLQYMPFGEDLVHQQNTAAYFTPYTFSGKERDFETGLSYFGARYYDAGLSIWLSVDPMSDKYPSLSAYNYCAWNPVMLVDPDGREIELTGENKNQAFTQLQNSTKLKLKMNEDGLISASGKAKTPGDKLLLKAIKDKDIKVTVHTDRSSINLPDKENVSAPFTGGGFGGNQTTTETITDQILSSVKPYSNQDITSERTVTNAQQFVNPDELMALDILGGANLGTSMKHEVTEAYLGGTYGRSSGRNVLPACKTCGFSYMQDYKRIYQTAHNNATFQPVVNSKSDIKQLGQTIGALKQLKFY